MKVVWSEQAYERLWEIESFIAFDNPAAAEKHSDKLIQCADQLAGFPGMGRRLPELPQSDLRELIEGNYRIVYRIRDDSVEIITVFEAHRLLPKEDLPK